MGDALTINVGARSAGVCHGELESWHHARSRAVGALRNAKRRSVLGPGTECRASSHAIAVALRRQ